MTKKNEQDVLKALLSIGADKPKKDVSMKRFGVNFSLQAIDGKTVNRIKEQATFITKKGAKELDEDLFNALIIEKGCAVPNWSDKQLLDKYGTSDQAILELLLAGELAKLSGEILSLSGFGADEDEEVKN